MQKNSRVFVNHLLLTALCMPLITATSAAQTSIRQVKVLGAKDAVEIEVQASERLVPKTQILTGPDRLVIDFPNAVPGAQLRAVSVGRGEVKDVRVGLEQSNPPMTRLVLDLKTAQSFQVFPYGRTLIIKVSNQPTTAKVSNASRTIDEFEDFPEQQTRPGLVVANYTAGTERVRIETPTKPLEVFFRDGLLTIKANKANLSEILFAVQLRTGAEVAIASGAEQEQVVGDIGPAPAPEVLARLLNGSKFNYLVVSAANDPRQLERVILTPRGAGVTPPQPHPEDDADDDVAPPPPPVRTVLPHAQPMVPVQVQMQLPPQATVPGATIGAQPGSETKPATDDNTPDQ
jgi:AMIN domain